MDAIQRLFAENRKSNSVIPLILAPMAGITDAPFRNIALEFGADWTISEMIASQAMIRNTAKSLRIATSNRQERLAWVQIAGSDPEVMAEAARINVDLGAEVIDINMGCPVKKIVNNGAGAALLRDEAAAARVMAAVVQAVGVPVTVKIRLGWDHQHQNGLSIARLAQENGVAMVTVHGRTRADMYHGQANWPAIAAIKDALKIPVVANGDVTSPQAAHEILAITKADAIMIGRWALGRPWIFQQTAHFLATGETLPDPGLEVRQELVERHFLAMIEHLGEVTGNRMARKHLAWYTRGMVGGATFRDAVNHSPDFKTTLSMIQNFFHSQPEKRAA